MKIKKIWVILLLPLLMSFQCDEDIIDDSFQTNLVIQNDSSFDLVLEVVPYNISQLLSQNNTYIDGSSSENGFILPSEFEFLESIKLYKRNEDEDLILVYEQTPIIDSLWVINESTTKDVDHILIIDDETIDN